MDLAVYFEVDSFLPVRPEFEFLNGRGIQASYNEIPRANIAGVAFANR